ncbi:hypothetical protein ACFYM7_35595 [Streptomyces cyaneofuscatus]|uniref:hypothetical protein n=1 Tax=Streptomyces cyaneofuscatus TaxID=66883 RepID=UPI0036A12A42
MEALFASHQLAPAAGKPSKPAPNGRTEHGKRKAMADTIVPHGRDGSFPNLGMNADGASPAGERGWVLSADHVDRLSAWIAAGSDRAQIRPDRAAGLLLDALVSDEFEQWIAARTQVWRRPHSGRRRGDWCLPRLPLCRAGQTVISVC